MARAAAANGSSRPHRAVRSIAVPRSGTALLLIDVINDLAFNGSQALIAQKEPMALRLAALKRRTSAAGIPAIYINDNFGQWRSDFRQTVAHCIARSSPGRRVSQGLKPTARDYFVLKPKHSGFFDTTLDTLLETLRIRRVVVTGIAGNICVLFTATTPTCGISSCSRPPIASCRTRPPITTRAPTDCDCAQRQHCGFIP